MQGVIFNKESASEQSEVKGGYSAIECFVDIFKL